MALMTTMIESKPTYVWIVFGIYDGEVLAVFDTEQKAKDFQDSYNVEFENVYYEEHEVK